MSALAKTFRGYERKVVPSLNVKIGDYMYFPASSRLLPVEDITRYGDLLKFRSAGYLDTYNRGSYASVWRNADGNSTIHVRLGQDQEI